MGSQGQAAMWGRPHRTHHGIGAWSARVLLITDLNSRIPVVLEGKPHACHRGWRQHGVPVLMYLPKRPW